MKAVIGRREYLSFPELGIPALLAKIDTGARTSSLHAEEIEIFEREGKEWVRFKTMGNLHCEAPIVLDKIVKSSNGERSHRYFITVTGVTVNGFKIPTMLSLASRAQMRYPLLLGRRALKSFLVDVDQTLLLGVPSST